MANEVTVVGINLYQEEQNIGECLQAIRTYLPKARIVVIDGAYQSWLTSIKIEAAKLIEQGYETLGHDLLRFVSPVSTDRTKEICKEFKVEVYMDPPKNCCGYIPWPSEAVKRNAFFSQASENDVWFFIDADEVLVGTPGEVVEDVYCVMLQRDDAVAPYPVQRIFRHTKDIKIEGAHHAVWMHGKLQKRDDHNAISGCYLKHYYCRRNERDHTRHLAKGAYYRNGLGPEEEKFRRINEI